VIPWILLGKSGIGWHRNVYPYTRIPLGRGGCYHVIVIPSSSSSGSVARRPQVQLRSGAPPRLLSEAFRVGAPESSPSPPLFGRPRAEERKGGPTAAARGHRSRVNRDPPCAPPPPPPPPLLRHSEMCPGRTAGTADPGHRSSPGEPQAPRTRGEQRPAHGSISKKVYAPRTPGEPQAQRTWGTGAPRVHREYRGPGENRGLRTATSSEGQPTGCPGRTAGTADPGHRSSPGEPQALRTRGEPRPAHGSITKKVNAPRAPGEPQAQRTRGTGAPRVNRERRGPGENRGLRTTTSSEGQPTACPGRTAGTADPGHRSSPGRTANTADPGRTTPMKH